MSNIKSISFSWRKHVMEWLKLNKSKYLILKSLLQGYTDYSNVKRVQ